MGCCPLLVRETGDSNSPKTAICRWHIAFPSAHTGESLYFCRRQKCKRVPDGSPSQAVKKDATPKNPGKAWVFWLSRAKKMQGFSVDAKARFFAFSSLEPLHPTILEKNGQILNGFCPLFHICPGRFGLIFKTTGAFLFSTYCTKFTNDI